MSVYLAGRSTFKKNKEFIELLVSSISYAYDLLLAILPTYYCSTQPPCPCSRCLLRHLLKSQRRADLSRTTPLKWQAIFFARWHSATAAALAHKRLFSLIVSMDCCPDDLQSFEKMYTATEFEPPCARAVALDDIDVPPVARLPICLLERDGSRSRSLLVIGNALFSTSCCLTRT
jgi:hypothetical protein